MKIKMRNLKRAILLMLLGLSISGRSQAPYWTNSLAQSNPDFYQIAASAQNYYDSTGLDTVKGSGYKSFKRWEHFWQVRVGEPNNHGSFQPSFEAAAALVAAPSVCNGSGTFNEQWTFIGHKETETTNNWYNWGRGQGVVYKVYVDVQHDNTRNTVYVGSSKGGLWRCTNARANKPSWVCLTDNARLPGVGVNDIVVDPTNANTIYISTGFGANNAPTYGMGIMKSTDGGQSWQTTGLSYDLNNPSQFRFTQGIFISPASSSTLFALSRNEIWKSTNSGATFTKIFTGSNPNIFMRDLVFMPSNSNIIIASGIGALVVRSTNGGSNWTDITSQFNLSSNTAKIDLAVTAANTNLVAASIDDGGVRIAKSTDNGANWTKNTPSISPAPMAIGFWYNDLVISPDNEDVFYLAATQTCKSTNGGASFSALYGYWDGIVHPDVRDLAILKDGQGNDLIYSANDGGVNLSENGGSTWKSLNGENLGITEIYGFDVNLKKDWIAVGCQDLGIYNSDNGTWKNITIGDGIRGLFDPFTGKMYVQDNGGGLVYSTDRGANWYDHAAPGNWENVMEMDALGNMYFAHQKSLYRKSSSQNTFTLVATFPNAIHRIWGLGISKNNPNVVYVGFDEPTWSGSTPANRLYKSSNALSATPTWTDISANLPCNWMGISDIVVDPKDSSKVWVCTGTRFVNGGAVTADRIHFSSNGGSTFTTINKNLEFASGKPMVFPINCMAMDEATGGLYIGSDMGVFYNPDPTNNTVGWKCYNKDMPMAIVTELRIDYCQRKILASTYGRGIWESNLAEQPKSDYAVVSASNLTVNPGETRFYYSDITIPAGKTMTIKGTVRMASGRKITVKAGGKILIDGGLLSSTCDVSWAGIRVEGTASMNQSNTAFQGFVEMKNGAIIENARDAVYLIAVNSAGAHDWGKTGGIIKAVNSTFRNNRRDVGFLSYHPKTSTGVEIANQSYFYNCQFLTTSANKVPNNELQAHITMWDVNGVRILGCTFHDQRTGIIAKQQGRQGIYTIQSSYNVNSYCSNPLQIPCNSILSRFTNLKSAVESRSNGSKGVITIENSVFRCYKGALLYGTNNAVVRSDSFYIGHDVKIPGSTDYPYGLYLDRSQGFNTEGNQFTGNTGASTVANGGAAGLVIRNTKANNNVFYRSYFDSLKVASEALSENKDNSSFVGLRFRCNDYEQNAYDLLVQDDTKDPASAAALLGMAEFQGIVSGSSPAVPDNAFGNSSSILIRNIENRGSFMQYVHRNPVTYPRSKPSLVTTNVSLLQFNTGSPSCPNNLLGWGANPVVLKQQLQTLGPVMVLKSNDWKTNTDGGNTPGLIMTVQNATPVTVSSVYNQLIGISPYLSLDILAVLANAGAPFTDLMIRDLLVANPHAARSEWIQSVLDNRLPPLPINYRNDIDAVKPIFTARDVLAAELDQATYNYDAVLNEILYSSLNKDSVENTPELDSLLRHPVNPNYHYQLAELYFDQGNTQSYNSVLNNIPGQFVLNASQVAYHNAFSTLYTQLQAWKQNNVSYMEPNAGNKAWLLNYISSNTRVPERAITLLAVNDSVPVLPNVYIPEDEGGGPPPSKPLPSSVNETDPFSSLRVYPNPSSRYFTFEWKKVQEQGGAELSVFDQAGRLLKKASWKKESSFVLDASGWPAGIYFVEVKTGAGDQLRKKLLLLD